MEAAGSESHRRLDQFVDAAFGFAVTLLVIAGAQPATMGELELALLNIPSSAAAFLLIALFWAAHRAFGEIATRRDGISNLLSLAIVFTVLVYVFPLRMLAQSLFGWITDGYLPGNDIIESWADLPRLFQVYGAGYAILSALYAALFARAAQLADSPGSRQRAIYWRDPWIICAASGVVSAGLAFLPIRAAPWLPPMAYWLIPIAIWLNGWRRRRAAVRAGVA